MSNKTRKYAWPVSAAMAFAVVAALAAFIVLASTPDAAIAHAPGTDHTARCTPDGTVPGPVAIHDALAGTSTNDDGTQHNCANPGTMDPGTDTDTDTGGGNATKPSAPTMMSISRATDNQARSVLPGDGKLMIKWMYPNDGGTPITGYDLRYTMTPTDNDSWQSVNDLPAGKTSYVIMGLTNGETYHVEVRAKNRLGNSPWSARRSGMPVATPSMPMQLSVADHHFPGIMVSWDAPSSSGDHPIDQYNWDVDDMASNGRDSSGTFGSRQFRTMEMQMFFPESGGAITTSAASRGSECLTVTVSASNANDADPDGSTRNLPGDEATVTCAGAPTLTKQMVDNVAILRWDAPSKLGGGTEVTEYVIRRFGYERINPTDTANLGNILDPEYREWHLGGSERSMWDTGLSHQTGYIYTIYAITDRYDLGYEPDRYKVSDRVTAFTSTDGGLILAPPSPPTAPRSLEAMNQCADQITLSWMAPSNFGGGVDVDRNREWSHGKIVVSEAANIEKYDVQYRERGRGAWMDLSAMGREAAVTSGLEFDTTYDFRVRAKNNIGLYSPWASSTIALEEPPRPKRPSSLVATHGLSTDDAAQPVIILQWDAPEDSTSDPLWREESDVDTDNDNVSKDLEYQIQRRIGEGAWADIPAMNQHQPHQYAQDMTAAQAINNFRTQRYEDDDAAALNATKVSYRVAALVDGCNVSPWNLVDDVEGEPQAPNTGNGNGTGSTLTTPSGVVVSSFLDSVSVIWDTASIENAEQIKVVLYNSDVNALAKPLITINPANDPGSATFDDVPAGTYYVGVASYSTVDGHMLSMLESVTVQ